MSTTTPLPGEVKALVSMALSEDIGSGDITSRLLESNSEGVAQIYARQSLRLAGGIVAARVFHHVDSSVRVRHLVRDGQDCDSGSAVLEIAGPRRSILMAERTALNFLSRLSGVATLTRRYVSEVSGTGVQIVDTRKTLPGYRWLDKYAVRMGGGVNHRMGLYDEMMIKDNHVDALGGMNSVVETLRKARPGLRVTIECRNLAEALEASRLPPDILLLDNMDLQEIVRIVDQLKGHCLLEVSGGVALEDLSSLAATGVDRISIGRLTHSAPSADFSLLWSETS